MPTRADERRHTSRTGGFAAISGSEVTTVIPVDDYEPEFDELDSPDWSPAATRYSTVIDAAALTGARPAAARAAVRPEPSRYAATIPVSPDRLTPGRRTPDRHGPTHSEITQDILIPESEFDDDLADTSHPASATESTVDLLVTDFPRVSSTPRRSGGKHRVAAPPVGLKGGRAALVAIAAGAAVAAAAQVTASNNTAPTPAASPVDPTAVAPDTGPGIAPGAAPADASDFTDQLAVGKQLAAAEQARENLARRPLFASPIPMGSYQFTSCFCGRWGTFHGGIDLAAPLGTPIHAATDGVVIAAGPASGYGNWVQVRANDGTVVMYGHMASSGVLVQKGQHVTAGDVIALVGSEGFSTGPHVHVEVWKNGTTKIDPMPWFAEHGVRLSAYTG